MLGNVLLLHETGEVKIIDWELSRLYELPFQPVKSMKYVEKGQPHHMTTGRYTSNAMIGDRGTECDR